MASWKDKLALIAQRNRQEIVKAKLDRREMLRLGLLTAGGSLIAQQGLSTRAFGKIALTDPNTTVLPPSPVAKPWVQPMPTLSENGCGRLSVKVPTTGCSTDAVSWLVNVIMPTWPKSR